MIPQGFPLWLVEHGEGDVWVVIGWREGRHALRPVAVMLGVADGVIELGDKGYSVFTEREQAERIALDL